MTASHWREKQTNFKFFSGSFNTSPLLTTLASTSWLTCVLFVATPMNWENMCTVCSHSCISVYYNSVVYTIIV